MYWNFSFTDGQFDLNIELEDLYSSSIHKKLSKEETKKFYNAMKRFYENEERIKFEKQIGLYEF